MALGVQGRLLISWHEYVQYACVLQWSISLPKCTQMTLRISMLKNIFLLHIKMFNT